MKRWLNLLLQVVSVILFILIVWLGGEQPWREVMAGDIRLVAAAFLLSGFSQLILGFRLQQLTRAINGPTPADWRDYFQVTMTSRGMSLILPRGVSIFGVKSVALKALGVPLVRAVWIVFVDKAYDLGYLTLIGIPGVFYLRGELTSSQFLFLAISLTLIAAAVLWWSIHQGILRRVVDGLGKLPKIGRLFRSGEESGGALLPTETAGLYAFVLTVLHSLVVATSFFLIARSLDLPHPWLLYGASFPLNQISLVLAVAPGGLGISDVSWAALLALASRPEAEITTFVIGQRVYITVFVLIWWGASGLMTLLRRRTAILTSASPLSK
ncbi:MAG: flippase-like domain-containing protein [Chloroflexi bacterium]|nr:flippase-like domain-containing protein [Chloroflexota bacterium]MBP8054904.1 flippase-like domain-containing protein [Chloroflexota bacterium]